ncbi:formin homology 2 domain containing protein [Nitzschia inconspicua]|uniref:Formin homology 2 domain containing protein n=1 Tax=Nitzschia inconspicua TaxID=303405 RepID=A0A9K3Q1P1_9STRA|nr:formin homology 2 domain containing protein [Nitzschia inconspicua]
MDTILDDIIDGVVHQLHDTVAPRLEKATQHASKHLVQRRREVSSLAQSLVSKTKIRPRPGRPPSNTDIVFITERFLVSSKPATAVHPTYCDTGRDDGSTFSISSSQNETKFQRVQRQAVLGRSGSLIQQQRPELSSTHSNGVRIPSNTIMNGKATDQSLGPETVVVDIIETESPKRSLSDLPENTDSKDTTSPIPDSIEDRNEGDAAEDCEQTCSQSLTMAALNPGGGSDGMVQRTGASIEGCDHLNATGETSLIPSVSQPEIMMNETETVALSKSNSKTSETTSNQNSSSMAAILEHPESKTNDTCCQAETIESKRDDDGSYRDKVYPPPEPVSLGGNNNDTAEESNNLLVGNHDLITPTSVDTTQKEAKHTQGINSKPSISGSDERSVQSDASSSTGGLSASMTSISSSKEARKSKESADDGATLPNVSQHDHLHRKQVPTTPILNSPGNLVTYLDSRYGKHHYLAFSMENEPPDDRTLLLFRRQIVQLGWSSPCLDRSSVPSIPQLLEACYAIHTYFSIDSANVALIYCSNGQSRSGIVAACYLKFSGMVQKAEEGFLYFLSKVGKSALAETILRKAPPSLRRFFSQFDDVLDRGCFWNCKPLFLKAVALQGLPVEEEPCIDIWNARKEHVFSSHPEIWSKEPPLVSPDNRRHLSKWLDEDGFYQVNALLDGDFLLLCRFGGDFAEDPSEHDPTKILFRYTNTTGCISGGRPYELRFDQVDVTKRYINHLENDFLVTLLFQADWEVANDTASEFPPSMLDVLKARSNICSGRVWRRNDPEMLVVGLKTISERHSARPSSSDIGRFHRVNGTLDETDEFCTKHIYLALQLSNFEFGLANSMLLSLRSIAGCRDVITEGGSAEKKKEIKIMENAATEEILKILNCMDSRINLVSEELISDDGFSNANTDESLTRKILPDTQYTKVTETLGAEMSGWKVHSIISPQRGQVCGSFSQRRTPYFSIRSDSIPTNDHSIPQSPTTSPNLVDNVDHGLRPVPSGDGLHLAKDAIVCIANTGVTENGLSDLLRESKRWTNNTATASAPSRNETSQLRSVSDQKKCQSDSDEPRNSTLNREAKEKKERQWINNQKTEAEEKDRESQKRKVATNTPKEVSRDTEPAEGVALKDDPEYQKYFKMLKIGMPKEQVLHAMQRDEKNPAVLSLDPNKPLQGQLLGLNIPDEKDQPLKEDPNFAKYFKMLNMGMPKEQVEHAMKRDGKDPAILQLDPSRSLTSQQYPDNEEDSEPPLKEDPEYAKYFKMLSMKLPMGAVKNALLRDGKDPSIMDLDHNRSLRSQQAAGHESTADTRPALKDNPEYTKYFKMLAMKLPIDAVKNALVRDGKDPAIMDLDPNKSVASQLGSEKEDHDTGIPLKDDPEFSKYFKMEKMGLPRDAVKNALIRDGKDPGIIDLDPNKSVAYQMKKKKAPSAAAPLKKKKKVRRKKIYWNPIDPGKIKEDSMWNIVRDYVAMDKLKYDQKEFEDLFTESADPKDQKTRKTPKNEAKKLVQVIDPKRSMNGGIVLARLKTDYKRIAEYVDKMEHGKFDSTQLKALREYLPDPDERRGLIAYMKNGEKSEETKIRLYADLSETEKYMVTLMEVPDAAAKLEALLFRSVFTSRFQDVSVAVTTLNAACDELRGSERLRKLMAMILTVVNQINTGGEGNAALGFTLDALLKLNEAKAFDKKTSVLHYVVKLVKKNDESLISFESDLVHVIPAENVLLDAISGDVKSIGEELKGVLEIVSKEAQRQEEAGELRKLSLSELIEQKTMVQHVGIVPQFNKMTHLTGRTSMERFTLNAKVACEQVSESIDSVQKKYAMVLGYFGEDENMPTADFFGILRRFMIEWKKAVEQVDKIEKALAKEKKRAAAKDAKIKAKNGTKGGIETKTSTSMGSLAAMAARRASESNQRKNVSTKAFKPPPDGIAALAAQAALKKEYNNAQVTMSSGDTSSQQQATINGRVDPPTPQSSMMPEPLSMQSAIKTDKEANFESIVSSSVPTPEDGQKESESGLPTIRKRQNALETPLMSQRIAHSEDKTELTDAEHDQKSLNGTGNSKFLSSLSSYRKNKSKSRGKSDALDQQKAIEGSLQHHPSSQAEDTVRLSSRSTESAKVESSQMSSSLDGTQVIVGPWLPQPSVDDSAQVVRQSGKGLDVSAPTFTFFLDEQQKAQDYRMEILRQNYDDSSVAIMAENFGKEAIASSDSDETWKDGGGISDFMGWANLAIRASDTESVRGFERSQNLDYNHDFDDESTIASNYYDDDASIASGIVTPRHFDGSYFDDYQYVEGSRGYAEDNNASITPAKVAASILFSESDKESSQVDDRQRSVTVQNHYGEFGEAFGMMQDSEIVSSMPHYTFGLDAGLSFGADVGFDDGLGFGNQGGDDLGIGTFGASSSLPIVSMEPNSIGTPTREGNGDKKKVPPSSKWFGGWGR